MVSASIHTVIAQGCSWSLACVCVLYVSPLIDRGRVKSGQAALRYGKGLVVRVRLAVFDQKLM